MLPFLNLINEKYCNKLDNDQTIDLYAALLAMKESSSWRTKHGKSKDVPIWLIASNETVKLGYLLEKEAESSPTCMKNLTKFHLTLCNIVGKSLPPLSKGNNLNYLE